MVSCTGKINNHCSIVASRSLSNRWLPRASRPNRCAHLFYLSVPFHLTTFESNFAWRRAKSKEAYRKSRGAFPPSTTRYDKMFPTAQSAGSPQGRVNKKDLSWSPPVNPISFLPAFAAEKEGLLEAATSRTCPPLTAYGATKKEAGFIPDICIPLLVASKDWVNKYVTSVALRQL